MYKARDNILFATTQKDVAKLIGIDEATLSRIVNRKQTCSKIIAYCITKLIDNTKEIDYYFTRERQE